MAPPHVIHLTHGRRVTLRTAVPDDVPGIAALFAGLSADSFTDRFQLPHSPTRRLLRMARLDGRPGTVSVLAERIEGPRLVVAEARAEPVGDDGLAELSIAVADAYQGSGLGHQLLDAVLEQAQRRGLQRLRAVVSLANIGMLNLLGPLGWVISEPASRGLVQLEGAADRAVPAFPARLGRRRVLIEGGDWDGGDAEGTLRPGDLVRRCLGPGRALRGRCPLITGGRCRLAESADVIVSRLPDDPAGAAVMAAHGSRWPQRLA